ncbi:MAG: hypothetical protein HY420_03495 [Candidatus Kerfeldbacteria bacterium]|nr:hypothetical protein [Candidatus Kerfeldbacteria bacterium]
MSDTESTPLYNRPVFRIIIIIVVAAIIGAIIVAVRRPKNAENTNTAGRGLTNLTTKTFDARQASPLADSDLDGLTNDLEATLGTNPTNPDTDKDGLSDFDEVRVYRTNPSNPDTDNDGNSDGPEVQKGYSPTGPGKLFEKKPSASTNTEQ